MILCGDKRRDRFATALGLAANQIRVLDLLSVRRPCRNWIKTDVVLLGGSGDYSVAEGGDWLPPALAAM